MVRHCLDVRGGVEPPRMQGMRLLLVDDDPDVRMLLCATLRGAGCVVTEAASAPDALAALAGGLVADAIITDFAMSGIDGLELVDRVRQHQPGLPAIIITGLAEEPRLQSLPPDIRLLAKPFRRAALLAELAALQGAS